MSICSLAPADLHSQPTTPGRERRKEQHIYEGITHKKLDNLKTINLV